VNDTSVRSHTLREIDLDADLLVDFWQRMTDDAGKLWIIIDINQDWEKFNDHQYHYKHILTSCIHHIHQNPSYLVYIHVLQNDNGNSSTMA
jgi:hypothetical protein